MIARVQADAVDEVPAAVAVESRPVCDGLRRLVESSRPVVGGEIGIVHSLDVDLPIRAKAPTVTTIHDLSVFDVPWAHSRARAAVERFLIARAVGSADAVIAVSDFTAEAVRRRFGRAAEVTRLAPAPDMTPPDAHLCRQVAARYELPPRFVLHVGTIEPRKDVARLITACHTLGVPLVLAGARIDDLEIGSDDDVRWLGYVPRPDLPPLYRLATVVAYPSVYEGFGLPPIEAMACGAAVVASAVGALPELAGDQLPLCQPGDTGSLVSNLDAALTDSSHRRRLVEAGGRIACSLSWDDTARATLAVYRSCGFEA